MSKCRPRLGEERFPSTRRTFFPRSESAAPRETTVLVFPTPPFKLIMPIVVPIYFILKELLFKILYSLSVFFSEYKFL